MLSYTRQTAVNIKSPHMYHAEYNHAAYSKNVTPILNNGICGVDIFKIMPLFKICDTYGAMLYSVPFRLVCRDIRPTGQLIRFGLHFVMSGARAGYFYCSTMILRSHYQLAVLNVIWFDFSPLLAILPEGWINLSTVDNVTPANNNRVCQSSGTAAVIHR